MQLPEGFEKLHDFDEMEQSLIDEDQGRLLNTIRCIVRLRKLQGKIALTPDNRGLMAQKGD